MNKKILIVGAGIGGLCASIALAQRGFQVVLFEQAPSLSDVGAGIQISPNAMHVLAALGMSGEIESRAFEPEAAYIRHYRSGATFFTTPLKTICRSLYGAAYLHLHRADLLHVLQSAAIAAGVTIHMGVKVISTLQNGERVSLTLDNDELHHGDILIGADGVRSVIREQLFGQQAPEFTGQVAWRGVIPASKLPPGLISPGVTVWVGHGRHIVIYYIRGGDLLNFVAVEERDDWVNESWSEKGNVSQLQRSFSTWNKQVTTLLNAVDETFLWALFDRKPLEKWSNGHTVLLGDACHPMLPFMAQGAAMAIEDAYVLAACLANDPDSVPHSLAAYEHQRKPRTTKMQAASRSNAELYHMKGGLKGMLRLKLLRAAGPVSEKFAKAKLDDIYGFDVTKENK